MTFKKRYMKKIGLLILLLPMVAQAQFGFQRQFDITVIKDNIQQKYPWVGGLDYCQFSNVDLNQDGTQDLLIFDKTCHKILTFVQLGAPGINDLVYAPEYESVFESIFPELVGWILMADYNQDGKMDIFTNYSVGFRVFKNTSTPGNLSFTLESNTLYANYSSANGIVYNSHYNIPAIIDVDHDGDLDILAYYTDDQPCIRYYKNMSIEAYGNSDHLEFDLVNVCYGNFKLLGDNTSAQLNTCCDFQVSDPEMVDHNRPTALGQDRHTGTSVLALDLDADDMMDLLIGDAGYGNLLMLMNGGVIPNTNSAMANFVGNFPDYDEPVDFQLFLGSFYVDVDNDGIKDLIVSPNTNYGVQNYQSNWFYKNNGVNNLPDFNFQTEAFLQEEMLDLGSETFPIFADINSDGLQDLILSVAVRYDTVSGNYNSRVAYYKNTGSASLAEFTHMTDDFESIASDAVIAIDHLYPAFGDLDGDGDNEMLIRANNFFLLRYDNIAGPGNDPVYNGFELIPTDLGAYIYRSNELFYPKLVDLNRDGLLDIVMGKENGTLSYYEHVGTQDSIVYSLITDNFGGISLGTSTRLIPEFVDVDSNFRLVIGTKDGNLLYYDSIDNNLLGNFNLVDDNLDDIYISTFAAPAIADIDGDNKLEMVLGNKRGGVALFESAYVTSIGLTEFDLNFKIFPNPAESVVYIDLSSSELKSFDQVSYSLFDITGRAILSADINSAQTAVDCANLSRGIYLLNLYIDNRSITKKLILE